MTEHRNVAPKTEVSTNFYGSVTGIVDNAYIQAHGGGGVDTNAVRDIIRDEITPATNSLYTTLNGSIDVKRDKTDLAVYEVVRTENNDLKLTTNVVDRLATTNGVNAAIAAATNDSSIVRAPLNDYGQRVFSEPLFVPPGTDDFNINATTYFYDPVSIYNISFLRDSNGNDVLNTLSNKADRATTLSGYGITNAAPLSMISETDPTFSNAVLAVGLNIDTNSVAVLNEIASTFGDFPITGTATTVGGLLAALAAAVAWLKKNKVQTLKLEDNSVETSADGGVAKLDDFFTESNSLLNGRLAYNRNTTGLKDRAFNALTFDGTEYNLSTALEAVTPTASGQPRDLLIVATATAATTISFTAGTIKGDKPTIDGSGTWLITLTEYASGVWYCRQIKMEDAA